MSYDDLIENSAKKYNVDPNLVRAVIGVESSGNPKAVSGVGAQGLMQIMPSIAKAYGVKDAFDPAANIDAGTRLLAENLDRYGNVQDALRAYHGGTDKANWGEKTQAYPGKVMANLSSPKAKTLPGIPTEGADIPDYFSQTYGNAGAKQAAAEPDVPDAFSQKYGNLAKPTVSPVPQQTASPGEQPGKLASLGAGLGHGFGETALGAQQLLGKGLQLAGMDKAGNWLVQDAEGGLKKINAEYAPYQQANPLTAGAGNIGGAIVGTAPVMGGAAAGTIGKAVLSGAAGGLMSPVQEGQNFWATKLQQGALGAAGGAAGNMLGNVINPRLSAEAQALRNEGIKLTPGQAMGGMWKSLEDKFTSTPLLGDVIRNAQRGTVEEFNQAAYNRALAPIGEKVTAPVGREAIEQVGEKLGNAYNALLPKLQFKADPQFMGEMQKIAQMSSGLADTQQAQFNKILQNDVLRHMTPQGNMSGESLKAVENALTQKAKNFSGSAVGSERELGDALNALLGSVRSTVERANPQHAKELAAINQGWANFARIRQAAAMSGADHGVFTPAQLQAAVRGTDKSVAKGAFAKGNALMQDLSEAGKAVIGSTYPDSGTAGRMLANVAATGALSGGVGMGAISPAALAAGAVAAAPYTGVGRTAFNMLLNRPAAAAPVGEAVRRNLPKLLAPLSASALAGG